MPAMPASQPDLFDPPPLPVDGLSVADDMLTVPEEARLADCIDAAGLAPFAFQGWLGKRMTASFGSALTSVPGAAIRYSQG